MFIARSNSLFLSAETSNAEISHHWCKMYSKVWCCSGVVQYGKKGKVQYSIQYRKKISLLIRFFCIFLFFVSKESYLNFPRRSDTFTMTKYRKSTVFYSTKPYSLLYCVHNKALFSFFRIPPAIITPCFPCLNVLHRSRRRRGHPAQPDGALPVGHRAVLHHLLYAPEWTRGWPGRVRRDPVSRRVEPGERAVLEGGPPLLLLCFWVARKNGEL